MEISKNDWKLFRERLPEWQERYMDKLIHEYAELLSDDSRRPSERFWMLNQRLRDDWRKPGVQLELHKQRLAFDLANLIADGAISLNELCGFSEEIQDTVRLLHKRSELEAQQDL